MQLMDNANKNDKAYWDLQVQKKQLSYKAALAQDQQIKTAIENDINKYQQSKKEKYEFEMSKKQRFALELKQQMEE